ncbi:MAG: hypothetical protein WC197_03545 [Candidatus Gastranaerophilaceae bacterium]
MNKDPSYHLSKIRENVDSILLLCNLAEAGIENNFIKNQWQLYLVFDILKSLSNKSINSLSKIKY